MKSQIFYITKNQKQSPLSAAQWDTIIKTYQGMMDQTDRLAGAQEEKAVSKLEQGLKNIFGNDAQTDKESFVLKLPKDLFHFAKRPDADDASMVYYDGLVLRLRDFLVDEVCAMVSRREDSRKYYISQTLQYHLS